MELRHLRYFAAVSDTRHFGKAAERLHMAQPPLSQAIRRLETELGVDLFTRTTRQVDLTGAGEVFLADTRRILRSVDEAVARVQRFSEGVEGVLRVGMTGSASYRQLPGLARLMKKNLPDVSLEVHTEMLTPAQESALTESRLDLGLLRPPTRSEAVEHRVIAREPLVLVLPEDHWLCEADSVTVEQLRHEDFVMYSAALRSVVNDAVNRSCLAAGFYPHCAHEVTETSALLALVAAGLGVALLPESVRSAARDGLQYRPVNDALTVDLALAWRKNDPSALIAEVLRVMEANDVFTTSDVPEERREDHSG